VEPEAYDELDRFESTHWWYQGMRSITRALLNRELDGCANLNILDAGCGVGGNLEALAEFGRVVGFDYSPLAISYARQKHPNVLVRASIEALPYADAWFDLVTTFDVIYCREVADDRVALRELARVTRPGGVVLVRVPALPALRGPHDAFVHGARRYTARDLRSKLATAGLEVKQITYANSLLLPLIFIARKVHSLMAKLGQPAGSDVRPVPGLANQILTQVLEVEAQWLGRGRGFPAGVSLFAVARKPQEKEKGLT